MVVQPRLVGVLLRGRSTWKNIAETDYLVLQHHPLAEGASEEVLQEELENLSQLARASIEGKVTSKKISAWLKASSDHNNILALSQPEDQLQHDDSIDPHNDGDGYLSDSSFVSNGDMTDPFTNHRTRPLRRAISLEDLSSAASIHRQLQSSGLLHQSRLRPISNTHSPQASSSQSEVAISQSELSIQPPNSGSTSASASAIARTIEHMEFVPLKDKPQSNHVQDQYQEEEEEELEPYLLDRDRRDPTDIPTPDVSPEEMSDSSEDLVGQGELAESRSSSLEGSHRQQRHHSYPGPGIAVQRDEDPSSWSWLKDSPFLDALVTWIEGPDAVSQPKNQEKDKPNPWLDIPFQFIALLTYPELDAKTGNKMTLTLVRETAFVRQRRRTLLMLTAYTLLVRYCSFDFFLVVLFASNCAMLFLMKNSGRMNVNMAKRAVRQRVGWAKQWAGSIFKRGNNINTNNINVPGMPPAHSRPSSTHRRGASQTTLTVNTAQTESLQDMPTSSGANANSMTIAPESSPLMKRRGLFGKKVAVVGHNHSASTSTIQGSILTNDSASVMTATTATAPSTKRRFFRRNQNNSINNTQSVPIPIPAPKQSPSILSPTSKTIISNAPLASSPLTQSQSLPQLQFSPKKTISPAALSTTGTTLGDHEVHSGKDASTSKSFERTPELQLITKLPLELVSHLATPSPSTPPLFSGLSQLLNRSSSPSISSSRPSQPSPTLHQPETIDYGDQGILLDVETELDKIFSGTQKQYASSLSSSSSPDIRASGNGTTSEKSKEFTIPIV
ncbi:hypothetical protein BGZ92_010647 [Podila epicladia]|nr:hypothetical protein BGZ92_010647 [Podila epicladia]